jgi:SPP1 family predicted phage head-tail adaptor
MTTSLAAGTLNRRITIQRPGTAQDGAGQPIPTWTDVVSVWANVASKSGLEATRSDTPTSIVSYSMRIRYRTDIDATMRVLYGGVIYDIRAAIPDQAGHEYTDLVVETGANDG